MVEEITKANEAVLKNTQKPMIIEFYSPSCGTCQQVMPYFKEIASELNNKYKFYKVNVDNGLEVATNYDVQSVPTFVFIKNNEVKGIHHGYITKSDLTHKIEKLLD